MTTTHLRPRRVPTRQQALSAIRARLNRCPRALAHRMQTEIGQLRFLRMAGSGIRSRTWCLAGLAMKVVRRFDTRIDRLTAAAARKSPAAFATLRRGDAR